MNQHTEINEAPQAEEQIKESTPKKPFAARAAVFFLKFIILATLALGGYTVYQARLFLTTPPQEPGRDIVVHIEPGSSFDSVAAMLSEKNIITDADNFRLLASWEKKIGSIQAGEFRLNTGWRPEKVLDTLVSGRAVLYKLSLREGLTWWETASIVEESGFAEYDSFARTVYDRDLLDKYHIPFESAEGFLFPDTYLLPRPKDKDARPIVEFLLRTFWEKVGPVLPGTPDNSTERPDPETLKRIMILASIVEKETGVAEERRRIAGVYANRIERRMLLQSDPTVIYGLGLAFDGNLKREHLKDKSNTYNTYRRPGSPPGPICSPGLESIKAAVDPEVHKFLYFVSKGDGTHHFSRTLEEHNMAVRKYQLRRR